MKIEITEKELALILVSLNHTATAFRDKADVLDALYDKLDRPTAEHHTQQDKAFFTWLARMG